MFTGIIEQLGVVRRIEAQGNDLSLLIQVADSVIRRAVGASVAVNGVCLTLVDEGEDLHFDVSVETLSRSLIGEYQPGRVVNLESALLPTTPLGGHLVSGHVDGLATIDTLEPSARSTVFSFRAAREFATYIATKGSVCLDGISLTVNSVTDHENDVVFTVNIVPHTLAHTNLSSLTVGDRVHLEIDMVARYLARIHELTQQPQPR